MTKFSRVLEGFQQGEQPRFRKRKNRKTINSRYSLVVTHPTTNLPAHGLSTAERTGSPVVHVLWSIAEVICPIHNMFKFHYFDTSFLDFSTLSCHTPPFPYRHMIPQSQRPRDGSPALFTTTFLALPFTPSLFPSCKARQFHRLPFSITPSPHPSCLVSPACTSAPIQGLTLRRVLNDVYPPVSHLSLMP